MKKVLITQSNYIPWKGYFDSINNVDEFIIYDDMQYTRRDWRNRNKIKTKDGLLWLSIPVEVKGKFHQKINETKVTDKNWGKNHWSIITANYSKAPYFKNYKEIFQELYLKQEETYLSKINFAFIEAICKILKIGTKIRRSEEFHLAEEKTERLVQICIDTGATDYFTGPAAKNYMNETLFVKNNITVNYFDYSGYPEYNQLFPPFVHEVSVLDLIFNTGPEAWKYLKNFK